MKTDVILINENPEQIEKVLEQADKVIAYKHMSGRNALHLRLLTEEMVGMMRSIAGEMEGEFWIEDEDDEYSLHLKAVTRMNSDKREKLLAASSSGKNESAKGIMGRLRDLFDQSADEDISAISSPLLLPGMYESSNIPTWNWEWSMMEYVDALSDRVRKNDSGAREAWDELEKSVVSHVADDVKVSIRGRNVDMTIFKKMPA